MTDEPEGLHEPRERLASETIDRHRAIASLMEELEAVDWYDQRVDATDDAELERILVHNRDEEKEHAAMVLEWLRRHDPRFAQELATYLFRDGPIADHGEAPSDEEEEVTTNDDGSLHIGDLKEGERDVPTT